MAEQLEILLSVEATKRFFELARKKTALELDRDMEPSGSSIVIDIAPEPYDSIAFLQEGAALGKCTVTIRP